MYGQVSPLEYSPITPPSLTYKSWKQKRLLISKVNPSTIEQINGRNNQICLRPATRTFKKPHPATRAFRIIIRQRELSEILIRQRELSEILIRQRKLSDIIRQQTFPNASSNNESSSEILVQKRRSLPSTEKAKHPPPTSPLHSPLSI